MNFLKRFGLLCFLALSLSACSNFGEGSAVEVGQSLESIKIAGLKNPSQNVLSSGQPSPEQITALADFGVTHVINLRPNSEVNWSEAAVREAGMTYHHIPVAGAAGITKSNAETLRALLSSLEDEKVLVHCGSGNRVGALVSVFEAEHNGLDVDAAIAEGKKWGLTSLESSVRNYFKESN